SDRQYRRAMPLEQAMEFIVSQSGVSYDPRVVDVLKRRYLELEELARTTAVPEIKLSTTVRNRREVAPAAGFEASRPSERSTGEAPNFTYAIAAARQEFQMLHEVTSELGNSLSMEGTMGLLGTRLKGVIPHDTIAIYVCKEQSLVPQYVQGKEFQLFS